MNARRAGEDERLRVLVVKAMEALEDGDTTTAYRHLQEILIAAECRRA